MRLAPAFALGLAFLVSCNSDGPEEACPPGGSSAISPYPGPAQPAVPTGACSGSETCNYLVDSPHCSIDAWKCTCQHRAWSCSIQYLGGSICPPDGGFSGADASTDASREDAAGDAAGDASDATDAVPIGALPPRETTMAARRVVIDLDESHAHDAYVRAMRVDEQVIYPTNCDGPRPSPRALCSPAFRDLGGHGFYGVKVVDVRSDRARADYLFAAVIEGGSECGAYGFWLIRVDSRGVRATQPVAGCFALSRDRTRPETDTPVIRWTPRVELRADGEGGGGHTARFLLADGPFTFAEVR